MYKVTKRDCPMFGIGPYVCEFICDTASDISTLPTSISEGTGGKTAYDNQKCASGSIANVAENSAESKQYMLNNQDIWCPYSVASGSSDSVLEEAKAYTDSEIADLINGAPTTRDTLKEIADAMDENQTVVEALDAAIGTKANKSDIPTKVSQLENDSGYLKDHQDLSEYAKKTDVPDIKVNSAVNADTVNGHAVNADVPADAKFTDTVPDLSLYALKSKYGDTTIDVGRKANTTIGSYSTAEGCNTIASGYCSHTEGTETTASSAYSHAEGSHTTASGDCSHAEGSNLNPSGSVLPDRKITISDVEYTISGSTAHGINSHAEGAQSFAYGFSSHAEGNKTTASGNYSHAEGSSTTASNLYSHAEGSSTTASGRYSHAEGFSTTASNDDSHAEGYKTTASGLYSHAEGYKTTASGLYSHAEGYETTASGESSHAEGCVTTASGTRSHAGGTGTKALHDNEVAYGKYNESKDDTLFSIGDGTDNSKRHNAFEITTSGGKLHDKDIATADLIPTELPANGGNADTVGGKLPGKIFYDNGMSSDLNSATKSGCYGASPDTLNTPLSTWWLVDTMNYNDQFIVQKAYVIGDATRTPMYVRNYANNAWSNWSEISTTAISTT